MDFLRLAAKRSAALAAVLACTACGGGLYLNIGGSFRDDFGDRAAPDVSLVSAVAFASAGQSVRLIAAASDDAGIDSVAFYRVDANADTLLGADGSAPYEWDALLSGGGSSVQFFAIATDVAGRQSRSDNITVAVVGP